MELWIRSQQKEMLYKVNSNLTIRHNDTTNGVYFIELDGKKIAMYKTRKRALEVLDEIHQRLIDLQTIEIAPDSYKILPKNTSNVYEMPKEGD